MKLVLSVGVLLAVALLPAYAADWRPLGPFGGAAAVVETDPQEPGTVYAATPNALLFRSRDGGDTWTPLPFPARLRATLHALAIDPRQKGLCLAGLAGDAPEYSGVWRTQDGGATWEFLPGMAGKRVWSLAMWVYDPRIVAAGTEDGVFLTRNSGTTWTRISSEFNRQLQPVVSLAFHPRDCRILYAGTPHLPWKTRDGGIVWRSVHQGMLDDSDVFSIHVDPTQPESVYASACSGIYRSRNGGALWTKLSGARDASYRTYVIAQDPRNPRLVYAGTTHGLVKSADGGATWRKLSPQSTRAIAFDRHRAGRLFVATADAGILRSDDGGGTLRPVNRGFSNYYFPFLAAAGEALYTAGINESGGGGLYRLAAGSSEWEMVAPERLFALAVSGPRVYAATGRGLRLREGGKGWSPLATPPGMPHPGSLAVAGERLVAAGENGLFRSDDGGRHWSPVAAPAGASRRVFLLGDRAAAALAGRTLLVSTDGLRWTAWPPLPAGGEIYGAVRAGQSALLAATALGLWRCESPAAKWQLVAGHLGANPVRALASGADGVLAAATPDEIYLSRDAGDTWAPLPSPKAPVGPVTALVFRSAGRLAALTQRQGVFEVLGGAGPRPAR
jgi:photosystem II stability/assembly factor-like uncharacterized protein